MRRGDTVTALRLGAVVLVVVVFGAAVGPDYGRELILGFGLGVVAMSLLAVSSFVQLDGQRRRDEQAREQLRRRLE